MALLTSHTLNGSDGTHAGFIPVCLINCNNSKMLFSSRMDQGGRLSIEIPPEKIALDSSYDLVFDLSAYWSEHIQSVGLNVIDEIVFRIRMNDPNGNYHVPVIFSPNSYTVWKSN
ncbi:MAG: hydroxyisourate hydrolase [Proteobacteria bacterium]|jgi:5-hydroxyisourate hydrolase|nr:hydroxyisourate hydrolase [Pseudomonadota bacterium]